MTEDTMPMPPDDLAAIAASDELLGALASGNGTAAEGTESDAMTRLLVQWRHELDDSAASLAPYDAMLPGVPSRTGRSRRWARAHRRTASAAALAVALAASTGVAAASDGASGPLAPLHRFLFGATAHPHDAMPARVSALLERASSRIDAARAAGGISAGDRNDISALLNRAAGLLAADASAPPALTDRLATLRSDLSGLAALPLSVPATTSPGGSDDTGADDHGGHGRGADDGSAPGSDDHGGRSGSDGSGSGTSGSDGGSSGSTSGSDGGGSGSTSGSDGGSSGSTSGSDGSGSGSTSGSDGSSSGSTSGSDGSGSGSGTSGSDGSGTSSSTSGGSDGSGGSSGSGDPTRSAVDSPG